MAYEPTNWKAGDTVTSAKLNKMEQGIAGGGSIESLSDIDLTNPTDGQILVYNGTSGKWENGTGGGGGVLVLHVNEQTSALDKTWKEIKDAYDAGAFISIDRSGERVTVLSIGHDVLYGIAFQTISEISPQGISYAPLFFATDSENGYPVVAVIEDENPPSNDDLGGDAV